MRRSPIRALAVTALAVAAALSAADPAAAGELRAGAAVVDASWHVGSSGGQYAGDGSFLYTEQQALDPHAHAIRREPSYGIQSRLSVRAIVVEGPDGRRHAIVKNDLYIPQDLLHRRTAQLLEARPELGIDRDRLTIAVTHNHSSPYYSSPSWGVWLFQDVFDVRFFLYMADRMAAAVAEAVEGLVPARVGAAVTSFDKTHRHSFGGAVADDGTPAGYPVSDTDTDMSLVRFDDVSDPGAPRPLANLVTYGLHPEFLEGNDLISADYVGPLERMVDRGTGAVTVFSQSSVGTAEPERSLWHPVSERLEFSHRNYAQAEYGARLMADELVGLWKGIEEGGAGDRDRFVAPESGQVPVGSASRWFPGPASHPVPTVSNCRTDSLLSGDPRLPILGLPDCSGPGSLGIDPGLSTDDFQRVGIPVPENYSAPSYAALQESNGVHLQAIRIGEILITVCSCEQWKDQSENIKTRTDRVRGNIYLGHDWSEQCRQNGDGTYADGPEGVGTGTWTCPDPRREGAELGPLGDREVQRMRAQVRNDAAGWDDLANLLWAESEPTDVRRIKGNFTHTELPPELGYTLTIPVSMANDYNGYIATYREYQRGDHYRKALTGWGPHSADYLATRLMAMGGQLKGGDPPGAELLDLKSTVDTALNDARAAAIGSVGGAAIAAYEALLPDDGAVPGPVTQPRDLGRFSATSFTWVGGSNYTDNPAVRVERRVRGRWREWAGQAGEVPVTLRFPTAYDVVAYALGNVVWEWTAHFEAFSAPFETIEGERGTPAGTYRFVVEGRRRSARRPISYRVVSDPFRVRPWGGVTVEGLRADRRGRVSFRAGPGGVRDLDGTEVPVGPIDYPDTWRHEGADAERMPRFIRHEHTAIPDPEAPDDPSRVEWFCFDCTFRPWIDFGDAHRAVVHFVRRDGRVVRSSARRRGDRWVATRRLRRGEAAFVGEGCLRDRHGNANASRSGRVGSSRPRLPRGARARCRAPGPRISSARRAGARSVRLAWRPASGDPADSYEVQSRPLVRRGGRLRPAGRWRVVRRGIAGTRATVRTGRRAAQLRVRSRDGLGRVSDWSPSRRVRAR